MSPKDVVAVALAENPDLAAARFAIQQAEARLQQSGLRTNPEIEISQSNDLLFANEGEYSFSLGFKQRFPLTGRLTKAKAVARVDVAMAAAEVRNQERLLAGEVLGRARDFLVLQRKLADNQDNQTHIRKLITVSENRLQAAETSLTDVNSAKLALQQAALAQGELLSQAAAATVVLNGLMGRDPSVPLSLAGALDPDPVSDDSTGELGAAVDRRPDRQLAAFGIDRAGAEITLARAEKWEDVTVGLNYGRDYGRFASPIGGKLDNFFGLSASVPLPLWNKNQGRISEALATRQRAMAELHALDLRIITEIKTAEARMRQLTDILNHYRVESTQLADENLALVQQGYASGLTNITAVMQAQQQSFTLRQSYLDTLAEYFRARTDWETATASLPSGRPSH